MAVFKNLLKYDKLYEDFSKQGCKILKDEPLSKYTTFKIGGPADLFIEVNKTSQLYGVIKIIKDNDIDFFIIGNGSNLLVSDKGFRGVVIKLSGDFNQIKLLPDNKISCGCGVSLAQACMFALKNNLSGLEFAWGIPGSCGGAIYMNAGAYNNDISNLVKSSSFMTPEGEINTVFHKSSDFSYRKSFYTDTNYIALSMVLQLKLGNKKDIQDKMHTNITNRKLKQPLEFPNCGSVFKRPGNGYYAGALIEKCGLKGKSFGGAMVSPKHAGFIINTGNATCSDVVNLIHYIKKSVNEKFGILLECEVKALGKVNL